MRTAIYNVVAASLLAASVPAAMAAQATSPNPAANGGSGGGMSPPNNATPGSRAPGDTPARIKKVQVVGLSQLPPPIRKQVDQKVASTSQNDRRELRRSIEATPALTKSLKEYGATSDQVVAVNLDSDGLLTLIVSA
jgi:hypothetical protein